MPSPATSAMPIERPADPLARGLWEAPPWAIALLAAIVVLGAISYQARKVIVARRSRSMGSMPPPTSRPNRPR